MSLHYSAAAFRVCQLSGDHLLVQKLRLILVLHPERVLSFGSGIRLLTNVVQFLESGQDAFEDSPKLPQTNSSSRCGEAGWKIERFCMCAPWSI